jgi:hypothetical protein
MHIHTREHLFKYATTATALKVIESHCFRWSAPTKFNDPFDHQQGVAAPSMDSLTGDLEVSNQLSL